MGKLLSHLPVCEHYVNTVTHLQKTIDQQENKLSSFDIIIDFEDGLGADDKISCAKTLLNTCSIIPDGVRFGVRLPQTNHPDTKELLSLVLQHVGEKIAYITLPKVQSIQCINMFLEYSKPLKKVFSVDRDIKIHTLIEDYYGLNNISSIAAHPEVECLIFGIIDFIHNTKGVIPYTAVFSPDQFEHLLIQKAKVKLAQAALINKKVAAHNACMEINDPSIIYQDAKIASSKYGFSRMLSIHPNQINPIISGFSVSEEEIEQAIILLTKAHDKKWRPMIHNGCFYDLPSYKYFINQLKTIAHPDHGRFFDKKVFS